MLLSPDSENASLRIELFVMCETAQEFEGRLNLLGTFESIKVQDVPLVLPLLTVAIRLRFWSDEEGMHRCSLRLIDADGQPMFEPLDTTFMVRPVDANPSGITNIIAKLQNVPFERSGEYGMDLYLDDNLEASLPFRIECAQSH
jgi:hypothetical protein